MGPLPFLSEAEIISQNRWTANVKSFQVNFVVLILTVKLNLNMMNVPLNPLQSNQQPNFVGLEDVFNIYWWLEVNWSEDVNTRSGWWELREINSHLFWWLVGACGIDQRSYDKQWRTGIVWVPLVAACIAFDYRWLSSQCRWWLFTATTAACSFLLFAFLCLRCAQDG